MEDLKLVALMGGTNVGNLQLVTFLATPREKELLAAVARREGRSVSGLLRHLVYEEARKHQLLDRSDTELAERRSK